MTCPTSPILKILGAVLAFLMLLACLGMAMLDALDLPIVYENAVTGKCVYVETWQSSGERPLFTCKSKPTSYERVLVDPYWQPPTYRE
jgi:hypothetical protein